MRPGITAAITAIPPRVALLAQALSSVAAQTLTPAAISVAVDHDHDGAAVTRNRALRAVDTEWTAFLDDDDVWGPQHLQLLAEHQAETGADLTYPWFSVHGGQDPLGMMGVPFVGEELRRRNFIPICYLVRTELARKVGGFPEPGAADWPHEECEDWGFLLRLLDAGASFSHLAEVTWTWRHHGYGTPGHVGNTSGRSDRW